MKPSDFVYTLPPEAIAQVPPLHRRDARLLHLPSSGDLVHRQFTELPNLLKSGDLLVLNETRVIPARLRATRTSGGAVELFLIEELEKGEWKALARPARRLHAGEVLQGVGGAFFVRVIGRKGDGVHVAFEARAGAQAPGREVLERWGEVPLPPYVRREPTADDRIRYQTVYARVPGAVAAPTAGLHFDEKMLGEIRQRGVGVVALILHVGPGTFRPLPDEDVDLEMVRLDAERYVIPEETLESVATTRAAGGRIVACGTTVVRALESYARSGVASGETALFIHPPYSFLAVDALVSNFHLPRSSLLCLVAAFAGRERILRAYESAVEAGYRFYSYGDATFLERAA